MKRAGQRRKRTRSKHWSPELKSLTKMRSIAIIGHGFVGKATEYLFERFYPETEIQIHDPDQYPQRRRKAPRKAKKSRPTATAPA